jgi:hypothetical protein
MQPYYHKDITETFPPKNMLVMYYGVCIKDSPQFMHHKYVPKDRY